MQKQELTPDLVSDLLARVPERFLHAATLYSAFRGTPRSTIDALIKGTLVAADDCLFDSAQTSAERVIRMKAWAKPEIPWRMWDAEAPKPPSISDQMQQRVESVSRKQRASFEALVSRLAANDGWLIADESGLPDAELEIYVSAGHLQLQNRILYDPLQVSPASVQELSRQRRGAETIRQIEALLADRPGQTAPQSEIVALVGENSLREVLSLGVIARFSIPLQHPPFSMTWVRLKAGSFAQAHSAALSTVQVDDEVWEQLLPLAGHLQRESTDSASGARALILVRTTTAAAAAKQLGLQLESVETALGMGLLPSFDDPDGTRRIPLDALQALITDRERLSVLHDLETVRAKEVALALNQPLVRVLRWFRREKLKPSRAPWGQIKGRWKLPTDLVDFRSLLRTRYDELDAIREAERAEERARIQVERERRGELRAKLVAAFPAWRHERRTDQQIVLHVGPPNSGKTHDALQALSTVESGWYLAPLRLLAFEVFERLNRMGVRCSLLTGEERIDVEGATVTAATIEMFNPMRSGDCVIIDEAQMLADPDRGWAWTRALMEAQAPLIQVMAPASAAGLIQRMAESAAVPLTVVEHERLAPIAVAEQPWALRKLPERTILVAFSRQMVLELKTQLELWKRTVSVVYGSLPPEVRRKQADRFADGQSEICIATDAVGMGLNLPADNVCFYDVRKFDGRAVRLLTPNEVQQIGGRAGRYGLSQAGLVGAVRREDLVHVRRLFFAPARTLTHARIAPTVPDLELIPGSLAQRLAEWAALKSIPDSLRGSLEVAALQERIELAEMLSERDERQLGLAAAYQLVNAPTRTGSRGYWQECARAIIAGQDLPRPEPINVRVRSNFDLDRLESAIANADIYLWLSQRREFEQYAPDAADVRVLRSEWSEAIDQALLKRVRLRRPAPQQEPG